MAARKAGHLELVTDEHGEVVEATPEALSEELARSRDIVRGLERDIRGWAARYAALERDKVGEARAHFRWPLMVELFDLWRQLTGHKKSRWSADRFFLGLPRLEAWGAGNFAAAIAGIAFEPNKRRLNNGKMETYDSWELLCRSDETFERYMRRRPADWTCPEQFTDRDEGEEYAKSGAAAETSQSEAGEEGTQGAGGEGTSGRAAAS